MTQKNLLFYTDIDICKASRLLLHEKSHLYASACRPSMTGSPGYFAFQMTFTL